MHARDHLVDGSFDGKLSDHDGFQQVLNTSRDKINNNVGSDFISQTKLNYGKTTDIELLAVLFEGYKTSPGEIREAYGEMSGQFDKFFSHVDDIVSQMAEEEQQDWFTRMQDSQILA
ncbi:MAG: hypothetical protein HRT47_05335 [Candidatus Caenarcaniphilales bacterium]|nr:hypothetical protein [Candidatus Caenarcaniphilales bacterium]